LAQSKSEEGSEFGIASQGAPRLATKSFKFILGVMLTEIAAIAASEQRD
jgi:hypothetical protein